MSWIRTAISFIGFGFAIVQFFDRLQDMPGAKPAVMPWAPRFLGLGLILCGLFALLISIGQYWWVVRYLRSGPFAPVAGLKEGMQTPVIAVAIFLTGVGLFAFLAVLFRL